MWCTQLCATHIDDFIDVVELVLVVDVDGAGVEVAQHAVVVYLGLVAEGVHGEQRQRVVAYVADALAHQVLAVGQRRRLQQHLRKLTLYAPMEPAAIIIITFTIWYLLNNSLF